MLWPDGSVGHTELRVRDSVIMLAEAMEQYPATPVMLYCYVEDCDATFGRAVEAGGTVVSPLANQFYGDRSGAVKDPTGNTLWIATHVEDVPSEQAEAPRRGGDAEVVARTRATRGSRQRARPSVSGRRGSAAGASRASRRRPRARPRP